MNEPTSTGGGVNAFQSNGTNDRAKDDRNVPAPLPVTPCYGKWKLFDSTDLADHHQARALCETCPALIACLRNLGDIKRTGSIYGQPEGTWAGRLEIQPQIDARRDTRKRASLRQIEREEAAYTDDQARLASKDYKNGIRNEYTETGRRVHQRRKRRLSRERAA